jgi:hypothetical protein
MSSLVKGITFMKKIFDDNRDIWPGFPCRNVRKAREKEVLEEISKSTDAGTIKEGYYINLLHVCPIKKRIYIALI